MTLPGGRRGQHLRWRDALARDGLGWGRSAVLSMPLGGASREVLRSPPARALSVRRRGLGRRSAASTAKYFMYGEDLDLSLRLRLAGWGVGHHPQGAGPARLRLRQGRVQVVPARAQPLVDGARRLPGAAARWRCCRRWWARSWRCCVVAAARRLAAREAARPGRRPALAAVAPGAPPRECRPRAAPRRACSPTGSPPPWTRRSSGRSRESARAARAAGGVLDGSCGGPWAPWLRRWDPARRPDGRGRGLERRTASARPRAALAALLARGGAPRRRLGASLLPAWQAPDENSHYGYVQSLVDGPGLPGVADHSMFATEQGLASAARWLQHPSVRVRRRGVRPGWRRSSAHLPSPVRVLNDALSTPR